MQGFGAAPVAAASGFELAARSRTALDRPLRYAAELEVAIAIDAACLVGAFQRVSLTPKAPTARRGSGGPEVLIEEGTVHVALALLNPGAFVPCDEKRIVNRLVRPLLRALTKCGHGHVAHYFGRDWISVAKSPVGWVGFAHDASSRRTFFEAFIAVRGSFGEPRPSFLGKAPSSMESATGKATNPETMARAIVAAYSDGREVGILSPWTERDAAKADASLESGWKLDPHWAATAQEAIGSIGAGRDSSGAFRVGGDLLVSRDALTRLEGRVDKLDADAIDRAVNDALAAPGVALDGIRSLITVREVIVRALSAESERIETS